MSLGRDKKGMGNDFIPTFPYASGHYTNGPVWARDFAAVLGLNASPSRLGGTNYASGGARTGRLNPGQFPPTSPSWSG
jgi:hypothetical protein